MSNETYKTDFLEILHKYNASLLGEYHNSNTRVKIVCSCGHTISRTPDKTLRTVSQTSSLLCTECTREASRQRFLSQGQAKIEKEISSYGGKLLSPYLGANKKITVLGTCGHEFARTIGALRILHKKNGTLLCRKCAYALLGKKNRVKTAATSSMLKEIGVKVDVSLADKKMQDSVEVVGSCGHKFETKLCVLKRRGMRYDKVQCPSCNQRSRSLGESELSEFIKSLGLEVKDNYAPLNLDRKLEIDIFVPSRLVGIEYNGLNWHSERILSGKYDSPRKYHIDKTTFFKENLDVDIIHVMESEWRNKRPIIESIIRAKLGKTERVLYARKCVLEIVEKDEAKTFLQANHRQGWTPSMMDVGLRLDGELVSVLSIGKGRYSKKYDTELLRFASKLNSSVVGGFSRLLKFSSSFMCLGKMVSYADIRFSSFNHEETVYFNQGFKYIGKSPLNYGYVKRGSQDKIQSRISFQKHKLKDILPVFDPNKTEYENMANNNYDRIWDCGNHIFVKDFN